MGRPHAFFVAHWDHEPLTAWSPGFSRPKPFEPPKGGTPNQPGFMERGAVNKCISLGGHPAECPIKTRPAIRMLPLIRVIALALFPHATSAQILINEIMA